MRILEGNEESIRQSSQDVANSRTLSAGEKPARMRIHHGVLRRCVALTVVVLSSVVLSCGTGTVTGDGGTGDSGRIPNGPFCERLTREPFVRTRGNVALCPWDAAEGSFCQYGASAPFRSGGCFSVDRYDPSLRDYVRTNHVPKVCWVSPEGAGQHQGKRIKNPANLQ